MYTRGNPASDSSPIKKYTPTCCASGVLRNSASWLRGTSMTRTMRVVISATRMPRGSPAGRKIWMVWGRGIISPNYPSTPPPG